MRKFVENLEYEQGFAQIHLHPVHFDTMVSAATAAGEEESKERDQKKEGEGESEQRHGWCFFIGLEAKESSGGKRKSINIAQPMTYVQL